MDDSSRDEKIIQKLIDGGKFKKVLSNMSDDSLVQEIVSKLTQLFTNQTIVITLTGGPGSGKSTLREHIIQQLEMAGHAADYVSTDDFGLYSRAKRNKLIAEGKMNPWTAKDWILLNNLVNKIKKGESVKAPIYNELTGDAVVVGEENFPHNIPRNLHFFIIEGDFQPVSRVDVKIYFHVPTDIRRENRVVRDLTKRNGGNREEIVKSFDFRLDSQYYPYTLPNVEKSDILIMTKAEKSKDEKTPFIYSYDIFKKQ